MSGGKREGAGRKPAPEHLKSALQHKDSSMAESVDGVTGALGKRPGDDRKGTPPAVQAETAGRVMKRHNAQFSGPRHEPDLNKRPNQRARLRWN